MNDARGTEGLEALAIAAGLEGQYWDIWGQLHSISASSKRRILGAFGLPCADEEAARRSLARLTDDAWRRPLPPVIVVRAGQPISLPLTLPSDESSNLTCTIETEDGTPHSIIARPSAGAAPETRHIDGQTYRRSIVTLEADLPPGYHRLTLDAAASGAATRLIVAPRQCYLPPALAGDGRVWGLSAQLYALTRDGDDGIGDFTALTRLIDATAAVGAGLIGLNPLHALFIDAPEKASPYSPSSRLFLNPLYIDVDAIPEAPGCADGKQATAAVAADISAARAASHVDYPTVARAKLKRLEAVFRCFRSRRTAQAKARQDAFAGYCQRGGELLRRFALFEALSEQFPGVAWTEWPEVYRSPDTPEVAAFAAAQAERICFFQFLDWIADAQLAAAQAKALALGLPIGLYRDLAVGCAREGADAWMVQDVICMAAKVGCPPDPFNMLGQDWQVPPLHPLALHAAAYEPFVELLRANMRHAGALRIDHVMGLLHLFWIPADGDPRDGAYVAYPFDDLLAILALESQRNRCLVVGEDLGTVPDGFRERMTAENILSYRLFYFEKAGDRFKRPDEFPAKALACVTTHDLATLVGFWSGADIRLKQDLQLYPTADAVPAELAARVHDRWLMLMALKERGLLPPNRSPDNVDAAPMDAALVAALHAYLAEAPSQILLVQLDDLLLEDEQINVPGTVNERPNWRRKLSASAEGLPALPAMQALMPALAPRLTTAAGLRTPTPVSPPSRPSA